MYMYKYTYDKCGAIRELQRNYFIGAWFSAGRGSSMIQVRIPSAQLDCPWWCLARNERPQECPKSREYSHCCLVFLKTTHKNVRLTFQAVCCMFMVSRCGCLFVLHECSVSATYQERRRCGYWLHQTSATLSSAGKRKVHAWWQWTLTCCGFVSFAAAVLQGCVCRSRSVHERLPAAVQATYQKQDQERKKR